MNVRVLSLSYQGVNPTEIESELNSTLDYYDVQDVQIVRWEDELLAFLFYEE